MNKRLQLQKYLDSQLEKIENREGREVGKEVGFDKVEEKLQDIQRKLCSLKDENLLGRRSMGISGCRRQEREGQDRSGRYNNNEVLVSKEQQQITPKKQLNIISKTMSEGYIRFSTTSNKKNKNLQYNSETKTINHKKLVKQTKLNPNTIKEHNQTKKKNPHPTQPQHFSSSKKLPHNNPNKTYDYTLLRLQKDIQICLKNNAQLKVKVNNLEGYKMRYCKLKQAFQKCQKTRLKRF